MKTSPLICHRGASALAPENTMEAFELARQQGQHWLEMDVCMSADGEAVIFHDDILRRCTDGSGWLLNHSLAELQQLDAGSWFSPQYAGARIPTLIEVLEWSAISGMCLNLEIKPVLGREYETASAISRALEWAFEHTPLATRQLLFSSFNPLSLALAQQHHKDIERAWLTDAIAVDALERIKPLECEGLHCCAELVDPAAIANLKSSGLQVRCFTVNSAIQAQELFELGVDAIFSDFPTLLDHPAD